VEASAVLHEMAVLQGHSEPTVKAYNVLSLDCRVVQRGGEMSVNVSYASSYGSGEL
jgi:hypothetical protein